MLLFILYGILLAISRPVLGDTEYMSVRTKLVTDFRGKGAEPGSKYFKEAPFHYHYDGRFAKKTLDDDEKLPHLIALMQAYVDTMADIGAETWIMHGTLLGWWWNEKIMPWDSDIDVQVSETTLHFMAKYYNMTEHHYDLKDVPGGRTYLLEINPNFVARTSEDRANVIDARWIDMSSGIFIDITAVRKDYDARDNGDEGALMCKDKHRFNENDIYPLRDSYCEGMKVKIPFAYKKLLEEEYGEDSLTNTHFHDHTFNEKTQMWEPDKKKDDEDDEDEDEDEDDYKR